MSNAAEDRRGPANRCERVKCRRSGPLRDSVLVADANSAVTVIKHFDGALPVLTRIFAGN